MGRRLVNQPLESPMRVLVRVYLAELYYSSETLLRRRSARIEKILNYAVGCEPQCVAG